MRAAQYATLFKEAAVSTLGLVIQWGSDGWQGGPNYLKNLALAVASVPQARRPRMVFFVSPDQVDHLEQYRNIIPLAHDVRVFDPAAQMDDIDVLYPFPGKGQAPAGVTRVHWIPDFQHCHLPHLFSEADLAWRNRHFAALAAGSDMVVLSSRAALDDFCRYFDVRCPTHVLRFATSPEPDWFSGNPRAVQARYGISGPYLMCCNQFWVHKDHKTLFAALALLRRQGVELPLVCTGAAEDSRHPEYMASLRGMLEDNGLSGQVAILGLIPRSDQIQLLRGARAVVQPSQFEGWSTVIEDCRLLGTSVVYSDIPVHLEQAVPAGIPFRAGDAAALADVLGTHWQSWHAAAGTEVEEKALQDSYGTRVRFGLEVAGMMEQAQKAAAGSAAVCAGPAPRQDAAVRGAVPVTDEVSGRNSYRVKGTQWYAPPLAGAATFAAALFETSVYEGTLEVLRRLPQDDYLRYLKGFMSSGMRRFGPHWKYADICTVLYTLADMLGAGHYLEIGVRQGRSMAMVAARRPQVDIAAFDMWCAGYAGMDNPGPDFVRARMQALGHTGKLEFVDGNSHETLPAYFARNPQAAFDLITVDGDHTPQGAEQDITDVLPHLRVGGAIVFDDVAHPAHPELMQVWQDVVLSRPEMSGFTFSEVGYGVGFAVRMR